VETSHGGRVKGEATDSQHTEEIDVIGWAWGMKAGVDTSRGGGGQVSGRPSLQGLRVFKRLDRASPILMATLLNNEDAEVRLTMRKAGRTPLEYLVITLEHARVIGYQVQTGIDGGVSIPLEEWTFSFGRVSVDYTGQRPDGSGGGAVSMSHDVWSST
jgi:type VI secretion system secreted protein Hcp